MLKGCCLDINQNISDKMVGWNEWQDFLDVTLVWRDRDNAIVDYCAGLHLSWNYPVNQFGIDGTHATNVESKDKEDEMARELYCESWNHFRIKFLGVALVGSTRLQMAFFMFRFIPLFSRNGPLGIRLLAQGRPV